MVMIQGCIVMTPPKSDFLLWFLMIGKLNTKDRLHRLNIVRGLDSSYVLCNERNKTIDHLFCYYPFTWKVQCSFLNWWGVSQVCVDSPRASFESWLGVKYSKLQKRCWVAWLYVIVWSLWELQNVIIFYHQNVHWESFMNSLIHRGDLWIQGWRELVPNPPQLT